MDEHEIVMAAMPNLSQDDAEMISKALKEESFVHVMRKRIIGLREWFLSVPFMMTRFTMLNIAIYWIHQINMLNAKPNSLWGPIFMVYDMIIPTIIYCGVTFGNTLHDDRNPVRYAKFIQDARLSVLFMIMGLIAFPIIVSVYMKTPGDEFAFIANLTVTALSAFIISYPLYQDWYMQMKMTRAKELAEQHNVSFEINNVDL